MNLINTEEAEKAANDKSHRAYLMRAFFCGDDYRLGYKDATEAANKKFNEDVKPVLEEAKKAIEQALNLKNLWYYAEDEKIPEEHIGEAVALVVMKNKLESSLTNLNKLIK